MTPYGGSARTSRAEPPPYATAELRIRLWLGGGPATEPFRTLGPIFESTEGVLALPFIVAAMLKPL